MVMAFVEEAVTGGVGVAVAARAAVAVVREARVAA